MLRMLTVIAYVSFFGADAVAQAGADAVISRLPNRYEGTYKWQGDTDVWDVTVDVPRSKTLNATDVELAGKERFTNRRTAEVYESAVRAVLNIKTLNFAMEELPTEKKKGFIPMIYRGAISADFRTINAQWVSEDGKKVEISLTAAAHR